MKVVGFRVGIREASARLGPAESRQREDVGETMAKAGSGVGWDGQDWREDKSGRWQDETPAEGVGTTCHVTSARGLPRANHTVRRSSPPVSSLLYYLAVAH